MLAKDAPWWKGEWGDLPHDPNDRRPAYIDYKPTGANASNYSGSQAQPTSAQESASPRPPAQAIDMSSYAPGKAQPTQTQSTGTPYGQAPGQPPSQQSNPYANMQPGVYGMDGRLIPGDMGTAINTANQQQAAMVQLLNQRNAPLSFFGNGLGMDMGPQTPDMQSMLKQAQQMVAGGWQNPMQRYFEEANAIQNRVAGPYGGFFGSPQSPATQPREMGQSWQQNAIFDSREGAAKYARDGWTPVQYGNGVWGLAPQRNAIQDLFTQNNIQAPQGFLDQLIGLLGGNAPPPQLPTPGRPPAPGAPDSYYPGFDPRTQDQYGRPNPGPIAPPPPASPTQWKPAEERYSPGWFYDDEGRGFNGTISFAPGTSAEAQDEAYRKFAESKGFYRRDANGNRVRPPSQGPSADQLLNPAYQEWRSQQFVTQVARSPAQSAELEKRMYERFLRETGRAPSQPGLRPAPEPRPGPGLIDPRYSPGSAQPTQQPSPGTPYGPRRSEPEQYRPPVRRLQDGRIRVGAGGDASTFPASVGEDMAVKQWRLQSEERWRQRRARNARGGPGAEARDLPVFNY